MTGLRHACLPRCRGIGGRVSLPVLSLFLLFLGLGNGLAQVVGAVHDADDVVPLAEEGDPVVQHALLLFVQVLPLGVDVAGLGGRLCQGAGGVLAGEDFLS